MPRPAPPGSATTAPEFLIDRTDLYFDLRPGRTEVRATLSLRANPAQARPATELRLPGEVWNCSSWRSTVAPWRPASTAWRRAH